MSSGRSQEAVFWEANFTPLQVLPVGEKFRFLKNCFAGLQIKMLGNYAYVVTGLFLFFFCF